MSIHHKRFISSVIVGSGWLISITPKRKAREELYNKDKKIELLEKEIAGLKQDSVDLKQHLYNQLKMQKHNLNEKHKVILRDYSEDLKAKYKENFDSAVNIYLAEISALKTKLQIEKSNRLSQNIKRPVYSPGRYSPSDMVDFTQPTGSIKKGTLPAPTNTNFTNEFGFNCSVPKRTSKNSVPDLGKLKELR